MLARVFVLSLCCGLQNVVAFLDEGDPCETPEGVAGECKFPTDCPSSLGAIKRRDELKICGYVGQRATICCEHSKSTTTTTTTTTTTLTTTTSTDIPKTTTEKERKYPVGAILSEKCQTYTKYAFPDTNVISGGTFISVEEFGHMVHIGYGPEHDISWGCGGSIISEYFILTAAHCFSHRELGDATFVRGGVINQNNRDVEQIREIDKRIPNPNYSDQYHDIGLIRVKRKFNFNSWVRPACIFAVNNLTSIPLVATGWGHTEYGDSSNELLKVTLTEYDVERCNKTYRRDIIKLSLRFGIKEEFMICAGSATEVSNTCKGDSGGPLQYKWNTNSELVFMYNIVGVTSFGKVCVNYKDIPGVYTRVSYYIEWIENIVWASELF